MKTSKFLLSILSVAALAIAISACSQNAAADNTAAPSGVNQPSPTPPKNADKSNAATAANSGSSTVNSGQTKEISSIYTDLTTEKCKTIESNPDEAGSYKGECAGVGGYKLEVLEGDLRQSINVVAPSGKKSELNLWSNVSAAFSALGEKAEWRVKGEGVKAKPIALIVRYNAAENPEKPEQNTSYLVVSKITGDGACVTDVVKPSKDANVEARRLADKSADKPCIAEK